jgi:alpha-beta hydrolase superfamily lysophospholipase
MGLRRHVLHALAVSAVGVACGAGSAQEAIPADPVNLEDPHGRIIGGSLTLDGRSHEVEWALPDGPARGLVLLEHGYSRQCANLRGTMRALLAEGLMVLCVNVKMPAGRPALADAVAARLAGGLQAPGGRAVPDRIVVAGHSAGAAFALRVGSTLALRAPRRLAGALLLDPVATPDFGPDLLRLADGGARPVRVVSANASGCNAHHSAYPALRLLRAQVLRAGGDGFLGLQLTEGSTHLDAEGEDSDALARLACGGEAPRAANVQALRWLAARWALDLVQGTRDAAAYPGGPFVERLRDGARAVPLE